MGERGRKREGEDKVIIVKIRKYDSFCDQSIGPYLGLGMYWEEIGTGGQATCYGCLIRIVLAKTPLRVSISTVPLAEVGEWVTCSNRLVNDLDGTMTVEIEFPGKFRAIGYKDRKLFASKTLRQGSAY